MQTDDLVWLLVVVIVAVWCWGMWARTQREALENELIGVRAQLRESCPQCGASRKD